MLELRMLGPFELFNDGRPVELTAHKPRMLLAMLVIHAGQSVHRHVLLDELWDGEPPRSAVANLRTYAAGLRRAVFAGRPRLAADPGGYRLQLDDDVIDLAEFDRLCTHARRQRASGALLAADATYDRARALWRGPALSDLPHGPVLDATARTLEERRIGVVEDACAVRLDLLASGRFSGPELVTDLRGLVAARPLRERPWRQLVVALYRLGDVAGALAAYADARQALRDTLGMDPESRLEWLHAAVLRRDAALLRPGVQEPAASPASRVTRPPTASARAVARGGRGVVRRSRPTQVAVCGPARCTDTESADAEELGRLLARRGVVVLCGGGRDTIEAVAAGVRRERGTAIGIATGRDADPPTGLSAVISPGLGQAGTATLVASADALIAIGGCWSALSTVAMAVDLGHVPVIAIDGWTVTDEDGRPIPGVRVADTPDMAVDLVVRSCITGDDHAAQVAPHGQRGGQALPAPFA